MEGEMQGDERSGSHVTFLQKTCVGALSSLDALFKMAHPEGCLTQPFDVARCEGPGAIGLAEQGQSPRPIAVGDGSASAVDELVGSKRCHRSPFRHPLLTPMSLRTWTNTRYLDPGHRAGNEVGMSAPTGIDGDAPVIARHEIDIVAPLDTVWRLHIGVDEWPTWQTDITAAQLADAFEPGATFEWTSSGFTVTSTIYDVSAQSRTLWGGTAQGITGIHEWTFREMTQGVIVATNESFAGEPVDSDPSTMQSMLDESLVSWLLRLKATAESKP
jgi:hypothetical protein